MSGALAASLCGFCPQAAAEPVGDPERTLAQIRSATLDLAHPLDTSGLRDVQLLYRFVLADERAPTPVGRVVPFEELARCFPADTPRVTPEARAAETVRRRAQVARRFR